MKRRVLPLVLELLLVLGAVCGGRAPATAMRDRREAVANPTGCGSIVPDASAWAIAWVDVSKTFSDMRDNGLALDANGFPHIAYGGDHLYYASYDGAAWHVETVDPADGVGVYASLELDAAGRPHIGYYDRANDDLKYAAYDGTAWNIQVVDTDDGMC